MAKIDYSYKEYARLSRILTAEDTFEGGMTYSNSPLNPGFSKILVNYDLKNQGTSITPRGGIQTISQGLSGLSIDMDQFRIHHCGAIYIQDFDEQDATVHKYILLSKVNYTGGVGHSFDFNSTYLIVEVEGVYLQAVSSYNYTATPIKQLREAHGITFLTELSDGQGLYSSVDSNTYLPVKNVTTDKHMVAHLKPKFNADKTAITFTMGELEAYEVKASQSINSGYNMLKSDPYLFANTINGTGKLALEGLVPRDKDNKIKMSVNVGEEVKYHLNYTYPATDVGKKYVVLWKVKNVSSSEDPVVVRRIRGTEAIQYTPGDDITLNYTVAYKQYTMAVEVYYLSEITAHSYVSDEDDYRTLNPIQSLTISSYYNSSANNSTNANLTMRNYNLATCTGMTTWQQRMVMWGVQGATTTLWVSQPNKPEYMPYPNNVEVFQETIMKCVPYMTNLLVFTESKLYSLTFSTDMNGLSYYTTKCVQERLIMTEEDANTIQIVKNMVYFKSGSYFYMIVPTANSYITGELQIAPVSNMITMLLDNFPKAVDNIVDSVYNLRSTFDLQSDTETYTVRCRGYNNYLDGNTVRNVYRLDILLHRDGVADSSVYLNLSLNYDTVLRSWTSYLYQTEYNAMLAYQQTITDSMLFIQRVDTGVDIVQFNALDPKDTAHMSVPRKLLNYQLINTGNRNHYREHKKRFREIQFLVNSVSQEALQFYTDFVLDDDKRKDFYEYNVVHVTDINDVNYGLIYVERSLKEGLLVSDSTNNIKEEGWTLDFTKFPNITLSKVRFKVSGKGYYGSISILSTNQTVYELAGVNWVYRKMNAR